MRNSETSAWNVPRRNSTLLVCGPSYVAGAYSCGVGVSDERFRVEFERGKDSAGAGGSGDVQGDGSPAAVSRFRFAHLYQSKLWPTASENSCRPTEIHSS